MFKLDKILFLFIFFHIFFYFNITNSKENVLNEITTYLKELNQFSSSFIQLNPDATISEGNLIYSENKIKINYLLPIKITFIAKNNKAMYFNETLNEVHYFNPNKTAFSIFKSLFQLNEIDKNYYDIIENNKVLKINLKNLEIEELKSFSVIFEKNPIVLKKFVWVDNEGRYSFSISNISSSVSINKKTFNMANPKAKS